MLPGDEDYEEPEILEEPDFSRQPTTTVIPATSEDDPQPTYSPGMMQFLLPITLFYFKFFQSLYHELQSKNRKTMSIFDGKQRVMVRKNTLKFNTRCR